MNEQIRGQALVALLNKKLRPLIDNEAAYPLNTVSPLSYLTTDRLDIIPKYIYAKWRLEGLEAGWPTESYLCHLRHINGLVEADGSGKVGSERFLSEFNALIDCLATRGFDSATPIPTSGQSILDGGHRVAAAIAIGADIKAVELSGVPGHKLGASELADLGVPEEFLDLWALEYAKLRATSRMVFIWPSARGRDAELEHLLSLRGRIVHRKQIVLSERGSQNLIRSVYRTESWLGTVEDGYVGVRNKAAWCFEGAGPVRVFLLDEVSDWLGLKAEIRELFEIEKNSVHINDTHAETTELAELVLNPNGLVFLNRHLPVRYSWFEGLLREFNSWIQSAEAQKSHYCFVGSSVLGLYGVREPRDLDFVALAGVPTETRIKEIDLHSEDVSPWAGSVAGIIVDPRNHFVVGEQKFLAPRLLVKQKRLRGEAKDAMDVEALEGVLAGAFVAKVRRPITLASVKGRLKFIALKVRFYLRRAVTKSKSQLQKSRG